MRIDWLYFYDLIMSYFAYIYNSLDVWSKLIGVGTHECVREHDQ
jgi:hypothetical protein